MWKNNTNCTGGKNELDIFSGKSSLKYLLYACCVLVKCS